MLDKTIKYYENISNQALNALKDGKRYNFKKWLNNIPILERNRQQLLKLNSSPESTKMIDTYLRDMQNMHILATREYNRVLARVKGTKDNALKQKLLNDYADSGIIGFRAKNGARWNIETYSNMYTTHINNQLVRLRVREEAESNTFLVSDHGTICPLCIPFEGRILTGQELDESTLFHPRCKHYITEVQEGAKQWQAKSGSSRISWAT